MSVLGLGLEEDRPARAHPGSPQETSAFFKTADEMTLLRSILLEIRVETDHIL